MVKENVQQLRDKLVEAKNNLDTTVSQDSTLADSMEYTMSTEVPERLNFVDTNAFKRFADSRLRKYFPDTVSGELKVYENFYFIIDGEGRIENIIDKRKEVKGNTDVINWDDYNQLLGFRFTKAGLQNPDRKIKMPVGIEMSLKKDYMRIKISKNKNRIRVQRKPLYVEYIEENDKLYGLIMERFEQAGGDFGQYRVGIIDVDYKFLEFKENEGELFTAKDRVLTGDKYAHVIIFESIK